ncbi:hypothetical protein IQ241_21930 [Romeria aff. gracilis LEGE 07310]|uniref:Uncharacterized protein n=1 Tax=Vasconcelosia minhoensis LEGE 07310 TaxID=915328 RepID=A0A8J7ABH6_9CYAN|nr:hypothetical protein [Romeria gracilis]MBE9079915.1 hypothetical protein [Romeria aff. gracilis LEGE 07310]
MDRRTLIAQARSGDTDAIAALFSQSLAVHGLAVEAVRQSHRLILWLEGPKVPAQAPVIDYLRQSLVKLRVPFLTTVLVHAQPSKASVPVWSEEFSLPNAVWNEEPPQNPDPPTSQPAAKTIPDEYRSSVKSHASSTRPQPIVIRWSDFDPLKLAIVAVIALYGALWAIEPSYSGWQGLLHFPDLAIHETGHLLFLPLGHFLMILGGSLTQILFPGVFTGYFLYSRQFFSSAVTLFWTGQNFMDVAIYMGDAPYRELPLTVDNIDAHDWWNLFNMMGCLDQAGLIAGLTHAVGVLLYLAAVAAGVWFSRIERSPSLPAEHLNRIAHR